MNPCRFWILLLLFCSLSILAVASNNPTHLEDVSINCGSIGTSATRDGREWCGDVLPTSTSLMQIKGSSTPSIVIPNSISADDQVPYKTARLSRSRFSYAFEVNPGQKILRLHFNPAPYKAFKRFKDLFAVEAGAFTLLSNFSASITANVLGVRSLVKEFCVNIEKNKHLEIVFTPARSQIMETYAFVNGIEIISVPPGLSYFQRGEDGVQAVGESLVYVDNSTALEIIRRVDIKQDSFLSDGSIRDMFGMWDMVAKRKMSSSDVTWKISVDVGFRYLIRIHFSKPGFKIANIFTVRINEMIACTNNELVGEWDVKNSIPWYRDYTVTMKGHKEEGKRDLLICLQSDDEFMDGHGPLKGFEIMKLSNPYNSLASPNTLPPSHDSSARTSRNLYRVLDQRNVIATVVITLLVAVNVIVFSLRQIWEASDVKEVNMPSAKAERLCRRFSLAEIRNATRDFSDAHLIGRGGFGRVYKGLIDNGQETVAIKRQTYGSTQGACEFLTEIETLTELRHVNLVSLIGYCNEHGEMILVYEYMACGTLADHLYRLARKGDDWILLTWKQRLAICIGAGRGLDYLHTGHSLIHRDVKASNILLDENLVAKVSDFGLAKHLSRTKLQSHVSTKVKGTFGYFDPNYLTTGKLTRKSDTYSFGVILLEVLSGRPAVDRRVAEGEQVLTKWARDTISNGNADQIIASNLRGEISENSLKAFVEVAEQCLHDEPKKRPTMARAVLQLEFAMEQQEISNSPVRIGITNEVANLSVSTGKLTMVSTDVQNLISPVKEKTTDEAVGIEPQSGEEDEGKGKATVYKPSRYWPLDAVWNKVKPSVKTELPLKRRHGQSMRLSIFSTTIKKPGDLDFLKREDGLASLEIIGRGGCGEVYRSVLPGSDGKEIAIKKILQPLQSEEDITHISLKGRQIRSETQIAGQIRHRNILHPLAHLSRPDCHYLVFEYMKNGSLQNCLEGRRDLDWLARYKIALGIAAGLEYLHIYHAPSIVHRDLKPGNILLDDEMEPRIADFGLAKVIPDVNTHISTSHVAATNGNIAPEYHQTLKFNEKCDVYSFGVVLAALVIGKMPSDEFFQYTEETSMVRWMRNVMSSDDQERAIDPKLSGNGYEDQMLLVLKVACFCTNDNPKERPNIKDARCMLSQIKH